MAGSRVGRLPVQATQCAPLLNTIEIKIIIAFANPGGLTASVRAILLCAVVPLCRSPPIAEDLRRIKNRERWFESKGRIRISVFKKE